MITALFIASTYQVSAETMAQVKEDQNSSKKTKTKQVDHKPVIHDTVVVTGNRNEQKLSDTPAIIEVISRQDLKDSGAENIADVLEQHVGVQVNRSFRGSGIQLQGFESKHVLILVDGERQIGRVGGVLDLNRFAVNQIERIEIIKGPSSALYGSEAMGGVIHIITRKNRRKKSLYFRGSYGNFNAIDLNAGGQYTIGRWFSQMNVSMNQMDAYDLDPSDVATSASAFQRFNIDYKTKWKQSRTFSIQARTAYTHTDLQGIDAEEAKSVVYDRYNVRENFSLSLVPKWQISPDQFLTVTTSYQLFRDQFVLDQRQSTQNDKDEETKENLTQLGVQYHHIIQDHTITVGTEGFLQQLESVRLLSGESQRERMALYAQDDWTLDTDPLLILVGGARADFDSQFGVWGSPKIAFRLDPIHDLSLRASYGIGYRAPSFKELFLFFENPGVGYVVEGNPQLQPEQSHSVNAGIEYKASSSIYWVSNAFYNHIQDLIATQLTNNQATTMLQRFTYRNIAQARTVGFDMSARFQPKQNISFNVGYTLTKTEDLTLNRALSGIALHRGVLTFKYTHQSSKTTFNSSAVLCGERPFYLDQNGQELEQVFYADSYVTLDIRISKQLFKSLELFVQGENLLNAGDHEFLPIQPRTFLGGLSAKL